MEPRIPAALGASTRLPRQLTSFVGRETELTGCVAALRESRMVTLCGPGGVGKTRLALAVAERLLPEFPAGVFLVELADVTEPQLVPGAVASALGVRERPDTAVLDSLVEALGGAHVLIVLDNCEHLAGACAELAFGLLRACPNVHLVASSREPLRLPGERAWRLASLSTPPPAQLFPRGGSPPPVPPGAARRPDQLFPRGGSPPPVPPGAARRPDPPCDLHALDQYESVRLFVERAATFQPSFVVTPENAAAVARICELTDGIPLAIELAAGRLTTLSAEQVAGQLEQALNVLTSSSRLVPARQRTLRATIDGSYERLAPGERVLFDRLSVFSGSVGLEAVRAVCADAALPVVEVLDTLARLIDKSLVQAEAAPRELRYRLLELLRQYAAERLEAAGEAEALRARHAAHFAAVAEASDREHAGTRFREWTQRLTDDRQNFRAALSWSLRADPGLALRLAAGLSWFWHVLSNLAEGRRWLEQALAGPGGDPAVRARALHGAGQLVYRQGDCTAAQSFLTAALAVFRELGERAQTARVLRSLGLVLLSLADYRGASRCLEEALEIQRLLGAGSEMARTMGSLALVSIAAGRYETARDRLEQSVALARQTGDEWALATGIGVQGELALEVGDQDTAAAHLEVSIGLLGRLGDAGSVADRLEGFARLAAARGEPERAVTLAAAAAAIRNRLGSEPVPHWQRRLEESLSRCRRALSPETLAAAESRGAGLGVDEAIGYATEPGTPAPRPRPREAGLPAWASARSLAAGLSVREWDVLALLITGLSNRVIAARLSISPNTVNKHVARILEKLAARSRSQAIAIVLGLEHAD